MNVFKSLIFGILLNFVPLQLAQAANSIDFSELQETTLDAINLAPRRIRNSGVQFFDAGDFVIQIENTLSANYYGLKGKGRLSGIQIIIPEGSSNAELHFTEENRSLFPVDSPLDATLEEAKAELLDQNVLTDVKSALANAYHDALFRNIEIENSQAGYVSMRRYLIKPRTDASQYGLTANMALQIQIQMYLSLLSKITK